MRAAILLVAALGLTACASGNKIEPYGDRTAELAQDCRERGGVLVAAPGQITGRPETDNICKIDGASATRIPSQQQ